MNFNKLHEKFKDDDSPSVEGQIRWLQKQGFAQHQIEQAMIAVYSEIERGEKSFQSGFDFDQYLLEKAKVFRTSELTALATVWEKNAEEQQRKWRDKWEDERGKPWYKRIFKK